MRLAPTTKFGSKLDVVAFGIHDRATSRLFRRIFAKNDGGNTTSMSASMKAASAALQSAGLLPYNARGQYADDGHLDSDIKVTIVDMHRQLDQSGTLLASSAVSLAVERYAKANGMDTRRVQGPGQVSCECGHNALHALRVLRQSSTEAVSGVG